MLGLSLFFSHHINEIGGELMKNKMLNGGVIGFLAVVALSAAEKILMDRATKQIATETTLELMEHFNLIEKKDKQ